MGSKDVVHSPSFTLSNQYRAADLTLYHFDFYRLEQPGIMSDELAEVIDDPQAVVAVEWAEIATAVIPSSHLTLTIKATGETTRRLTFDYPKELGYLFPTNA